MAARRTDGRYSTTVTVLDPKTGEKKKKYVYGKTRRELNANIEKARKSYGNPDTPFRQVIQEWYASAKAASSNNTKRMYDTAIAKLDPIANIPVGKITAADLNEILLDLGEKKNQAQKVYMTMNQIFEMAVYMGYIDRNPCRYLSKPKYRSAEKRVATEEERKAADMTVFTPREALFMRLIRNYGLRKSEALAVRRQSFDFKENRLIVDTAVEFSSNQAGRKDPKSKSGYRKIPLLNKDIVFFKNAVKSAKHEYLFTNYTDDRPISATSYKHMWNSIMKKMNRTASENGLKLPGTLTCHVWRHTYCTDLLMAGVDPKTVQYLMGHSNISVTMDIYTHINENAIDLSRFEKMIGETADEQTVS